MKIKKSKKTRLLFGQRVKQLRKAQKISQGQLAFESELSLSGISVVERGMKNVSLETSLAIAKAFGMKLKELYDFEYEE